MQTVSAIITTYNYGPYIGGAIESVLQQTRRPDEILVVDDGSTDNTAEIVGRYADRGVRYLYKRNGGASSARNAGIRATGGDLLAFLDSDDRWLPEKTEIQLTHLAEYPSAGLITGGEWQVQEVSGERRLTRRRFVGAQNLYRQLLVENMVGNSSLALIKRDCFRQVGVFDEKVGLGQDWDMWLRIGRRFPIGVVDAPLMTMIFHEGSMTSGQSGGRIVSNNAIQRRYIGRVRSPLLRLILLCKARSMTYFYVGAGAADTAGKRLEALRFATLALLLDPTYETRLKVALFFRTLFGRQAFSRVRELLRRG